MSQTALYLKWIALISVVMGFFGVGVLLIGYKDPSFGKVATIVVLWLTAAALTVISRRSKSAHK